MVYVSLALTVLLLVVAVTFAQLLRAQQRAHARRENLLLNQLLNVVGKPWEPAPADAPAAPEPEREWTPKVVRFTATPEAFPVTPELNQMWDAREGRSL